AVHQEMPVPDELACLRSGSRQSESINHVVQAPLEELEQRFTRDAARTLCRLEIVTELILEHPVDALDLLLLAKLETVAGELRFTGLAVLPGREVSLFDGALLRVAAFPFQKQLHRLAAAQPTDGSNVAGHQRPFKELQRALESYAPSLWRT